VFKFEILKKSRCSKARVGKITTPHGEIITPAFIPVATLGVIKGGLDYLDVEKCKVQCAIVNTFHFLDLDAVDTVKKAGGLHGFMNFPKPIFTDSGGFQVFSLGKGAEYGLGKIQSIFPEDRRLTQTERGLTQIKMKLKNAKDNLDYVTIVAKSRFKNEDNFTQDKLVENRSAGLVKKISEEGVEFLSPRDGRTLMLTPEKSTEIQIKLGADFIYLLDICGSVVDTQKQAKTDMERTHRWYQRFLEAQRGITLKSNAEKRGSEVKSQGSMIKDQKTFGIIQGGLYKDLRLASTEFVNNLPVFGTAIGGAFIKKDLLKILSWISQKTDYSRPHHMLGVGDIESIPDIIKLGIDLFDCALPTRIARHGTAITKMGYRDIRKNEFKNKFQPIDKNCKCFTCENYTLAQLNFLVRAKEPLAGRLLTIHNLFFFESYLEELRDKIESGRL